MVDYIKIAPDEELGYAVSVIEFFDPFGNEDYFDTVDEAYEHAIKLASYHKVEIREVDENGKLIAYIVNELL